MRGYLLAYDVRDPKRWRKVHMVAQSYGEPLQYSVFQCILTAERRVELEHAISQVIRRDQDAVLIVDLGRVEAFPSRITRLGAQSLADPPGPVVL